MAFPTGDRNITITGASLVSVLYLNYVNSVGDRFQARWISVYFYTVRVGFTF